MIYDICMCVQNSAQMSLPPQRGQLQSFVESVPPPLPSAEQQLPQRPTAVPLRNHQSLCMQQQPRQVMSGVSTLSAGSEGGIYQSLDPITQQSQSQFIAFTPDALGVATAGAGAGDSVVQLRSPPKSPSYHYMGASTLSSGHNSTLPEFVPPPPPQLEMPPEMQALSAANGQLVLAAAPSVNQLGVGGQPNIYGFTIGGQRNSQVLNQTELAAAMASSPSSGVAPPLPPNRTIYTPVFVNLMPGAPGSGEVRVSAAAPTLTPRNSTPLNAYVFIPSYSGGMPLAYDAAPTQSQRNSFALDAARPLSHLSNLSALSSLSHPPRPAGGSPQTSPAKHPQVNSGTSQPGFKNPRLLSQFGTGRSLVSTRGPQENGFPPGTKQDASPLSPVNENTTTSAPVSQAPAMTMANGAPPPPVAPRNANGGVLIGAQQDSFCSENFSDGQLESSAAAGMSELSELTEPESTTADDDAYSDPDACRGAKPAAGTTSLNTSKHSSTRQQRAEMCSQRDDSL